MKGGLQHIGPAVVAAEGLSATQHPAAQGSAQAKRCLQAGCVKVREHGRWQVQGRGRDGGGLCTGVEEAKGLGGGRVGQLARVRVCVEVPIGGWQGVMAAWAQRGCVDVPFGRCRGGGCHQGGTRLCGGEGLGGVVGQLVWGERGGWG